MVRGAGVVLPRNGDGWRGVSACRPGPRTGTPSEASVRTAAGTAPSGRAPVLHEILPRRDTRTTAIANLFFLLCECLKMFDQEKADTQIALPPQTGGEGGCVRCVSSRALFSHVQRHRFLEEVRSS